MKSKLAGSWTKTAMVCAFGCFLVGLIFPAWNYWFGPTHFLCFTGPSRAEKFFGICKEPVSRDGSGFAPVQCVTVVKEKPPLRAERITFP